MKPLATVLVSFALAGCGSPAAPQVAMPARGSAAPPVAPPATPEPASTAAPSTARKRARTAAASPREHDGTKPKNGRPLNPKDNLGRTVFVRADDQCFVEVAPKEKPAADAPIVRATEVVDCPPAADDPAWDHCAAQIVVDDGGKCFCVSGAGNPRPMPRATACPASK
jgi:hypothetical protein